VNRARLALLAVLIAAAQSFAATVELRDRTALEGSLTFQSNSVIVTDAAGHTKLAPMKDTARIAFFSAPRVMTLSNAPWHSADIGDVSVPGATKAANGALALTASGWGFWRDADGVRFASVPLAGDGEIIARVHGFDESNGAVIAGISIRESLGPRARHISLVQSSKGTLAFRARDDEGFSRRTLPVEQTNSWLRLTRSGSRLAAYMSDDAKEWTPIEGASLHATNALHIGLFASTEINDNPGTARFRDVTIHEGTVSKPRTDLPAPAIVLRDGTVLAGQIIATNESVQFVRDGVTNYFNINGLAALLFRPVAADIVLQPAISPRTGVVMNDRDWLEGDVREFNPRGVVVATVLFGAKTVRWTEQPAAIVVGGRTETADWELILKDGSQVRAKDFFFVENGGTARTASLPRLPFRVSDLIEIRSSADRR
jgi:hypothetical protein